MPVHFSPEGAAALADAAQARRTSRGAAAYAAIVANEAELRRRLKPPPASGSLPAPRTKPRFYTAGGSKRLDLYLSPTETQAITSLLRELDLEGDAGRLFREAVDLEYRDVPVDHGAGTSRGGGGGGDAPDDGSVKLP